MKSLNVPNALTTARVALIPVFITAVLYNRYDYALYLFALAALTDLFDGLLARLSGQRTPLGEFLDPLADKFILITSFVLFSYHGWIPLWLTITVVSRDIIVVVGWMLLYLLSHVRRVEPSVLGKLSIASEFVLISYVLLGLNFGLSDGLLSVLIRLTATLTVLSAFHYLYRGLRTAGEKR